MSLKAHIKSYSGFFPQGLIDELFEELSQQTRLELLLCLFNTPLPNSHHKTTALLSKVDFERLKQDVSTSITRLELFFDPIIVNQYNKMITFRHFPNLISLKLPHLNRDAVDSKDDRIIPWLFCIGDSWSSEQDDDINNKQLNTAPSHNSTSNQLPFDSKSSNQQPQPESSYQRCTLPNLKSLSLSMCYLDLTDIKYFFQSTSFPILEELDISRNDLGDIDVFKLFLLWLEIQLPLLKSLNLEACQLSTESLILLSQSPIISRLSKLNLECNDLDDENVMILLNSPLFSSNHNITSLSISKPYSSYFSHPIFAALSNHPNLSNLKELYLINTGIDDDGVEVISKSVYLKKIEILDFSSWTPSLLTNKSLINLSSSSTMYHLKELKFHGGNITEEGLAAAGVSEVMGRLEKLDLQGGVHLSPTPNLFSFINSPHLSKLKYLNLAGAIVEPRALAVMGLCGLTFDHLTTLCLNGVNLGNMKTSKNELNQVLLHFKSAEKVEYDNLNEDYNHMGRHVIFDEGDDDFDLMYPVAKFLFSHSTLLNPHTTFHRPSSSLDNGVRNTNIDRNRCMFPMLRQLFLSKTMLQDQDLFFISQSPLFHNLDELDLSYNPDITDVGVGYLVGSDIISGFGVLENAERKGGSNKTITVHNSTNPHTHPQSPFNNHPRSLTKLNLNYNPKITFSGLSSLIDNGTMMHLAVINIRGTGITGVAILMKWGWYYYKEAVYCYYYNNYKK